MNIKWRRFLALFLILSVLPFSAVAEATSTPVPTNAAGYPYVLDYFTNTPLDVTQYEGTALFLNFFTGWCPYCMQEMPEIKQIFDTYSPDDVAIILVHAWDGEDASDSATVVEKYGLQNMIMLEDEQMTLTSTIGLTGFPTSIFIGKDGYLANYTPGALTFDTMSGILDGMGIAKRDGTSAQTAPTNVPSLTATPEATATPAPKEADATSGATSKGGKK